MRLPGLFEWKEAPFLRFIPPFIIGIIIQCNSSLPIPIGWIFAIGCSIGIMLISLLTIPLQFRLRLINGILLNGLLLTAGLLLTHYKDIRHHQQWFQHHYTAGDTIIVTIEEPLTEKAKSYSASATVQAVIKEGHIHPVKGRIIIYFQKDSLGPHLHYGNQLMFVKPPEPISNTDNPHAFNYARYCAFKGIYHQVYLGQQEYIVAEKKQINPVKKVLYHTRKKLLDIIRENITDKKQAGLAEALLIGYKDDLDKHLLQSYINTGVVHVIAVSGLHLGLIYALMTILCNKLRKRWLRWVTPLIIIAGLWLFAFLTGASPSVLRSAIMFTFLIIGNQLPWRGAAYNSLAASAFLLLCYDPWLCWDVGFQLSYAAVLSIMLFMKPVYHSVFIPNKYLNYGWKLVAVTIAAQILTLPVSIYHFHQFPNLFLITNLVAVPLSGIILIGELVLCAVSFIPIAAKAIGWVLNGAIRFLNGFIETTNQLPFNTTDGIQLNILQVALLYAIIASLAIWLVQKKKAGLFIALGSFWLFLIIHAQSWWQADRQQKLIVYNVPKHQAIDFISGREYVFRGDSLLMEDPLLQNFHLKPSRIAHRTERRDTLENLLQAAGVFRFGNTSVLLIDRALPSSKQTSKIPVDLIVLSHNPGISVPELINLFNCHTIIIDATNSLWKTRSWQQDCHKLGISCHAVTNQGAFVLNLH